jgi:acetoin utilization deacetylase AcuC-like enzyme
MSSLAIVKDDRYLEHNPGAGHPESPERLRVIHDLIKKEFSTLPLIPPRLAAESELALVHDPFYIQTVADTEGRDRSQLDHDTGLSARSYEIARLAAGGLLEAVDAILGKLPLPPSERVGVRGESALRAPHSAFAFVRPPGHHAEPGRGMGFCIFNNVAIAAEYAIEKYGVKRVLIVDWDLHHGNGTQHTFYDRPDVLFFSSHQFPHYPGTGNFDEVGSGKGEGHTVNAPFPHGFGDSEYLSVYNRILKPIALEYKPELVLVSAGFDPYVKDPLGGIMLTAEGFGAIASIVRDIAERTCKGKVLLTLEGGYSPEGLHEGVRAVLNAFVGSQKTVQIPAAPAAERVIQTIISLHKKYWKSLK